MEAIIFSPTVYCQKQTKSIYLGIYLSIYLSMYVSI